MHIRACIATQNHSCNIVHKGVEIFFKIFSDKMGQKCWMGAYESMGVNYGEYSIKISGCQVVLILHQLNF